MPSAFEVLVRPEWWNAIEKGMRIGTPARLPAWPLRKKLTDIAGSANFVGRGLGYDVFRIPDTNVVIKVAMDRDPRAMAESFIGNQCESYRFWRSRMGDQFIPTTFMFAYPHPGRPGNRGCELQTLVPGPPLWRISRTHLHNNPGVTNRLDLMIGRILRVFQQTGRLPDVVGCHASAPLYYRLQRSARLTSNIRLDAGDWPWIVDVGAWPRGFSLHVAPFRRRLLIHKLAWDLRLFQAELNRYVQVQRTPTV